MRGNALRKNKTKGIKWWSKIGTYLRQELSTTHVDASTRQTFGQILPGTSSSEIDGITTRFDPRVPEREIQTMGVRDAYIRDDNLEILHIRNVSHGTAGQTYERPQRQRPSARRPNFNFIVFFILLVTVFPGAFLYAACTVRPSRRWIFILLLLMSILYFVWIIGNNI